MRLYTRTGDDGSTGLFGGQRVMKDHIRVDAYGHVDELNACIGLALSSGADQSATRGILAMRDILTRLQSLLFDLGADLTTPHGSKHEDKVKRLTQQHVDESERWIDEIDGENNPITAFVLPGGTELASRMHLARTICRRAERAMVQLSRAETVNPHAITFINRASDLLFAMARRANKEAGVPDVPWVPQA